MLETVEPLLWSIKQTAERIGITRSSLYMLLNCKKIPKPIKLGGRVLFRVADIKLWVVLNCPNQAQLQRYVNTQQRRRQKKNTENLTDAYVRQLLRANTCLRAKDIPKDIIKAKQEHIKLYRKLKTIQGDVHENDERSQRQVS